MCHAHAKTSVMTTFWAFSSQLRITLSSSTSLLLIFLVNGYFIQDSQSFNNLWSIFSLFLLSCTRTFSLSSVVIKNISVCKIDLEDLLFLVNDLKSNRLINLYLFLYKIWRRHALRLHFEIFPIGGLSVEDVRMNISILCPLLLLQLIASEEKKVKIICALNDALIDCQSCYVKVHPFISSPIQSITWFFHRLLNPLHLKFLYFV